MALVSIEISLFKRTPSIGVPHVLMPCLDSHSAPLAFSTQTKSSEDKTSFGTSYDVKEVRISQEKHLSLGFPLSYQLNSAGRAALVGRSAGTG